jgi:CDP-diacylglycerol pyrophosphatase
MVAVPPWPATSGRPSWNRRIVIMLVGASCLVPTGTQAANPNTLWNIVHDECVPSWLRAGDPSPCAVVDVRRGVGSGYAILKDLEGAAQYLLIPTSRITGIESPAIITAHAKNYFAEAWRWRSLFESLLHRAVPRGFIGLAINSKSGRTQNQLHIHIDCLRSDVSFVLRRHLAELGRDWQPFPEELVGHHYMAARVLGTNLDVNPFKLLARRIPGAGHQMGKYSLVVVGATFARQRNGFVVLAGHVDREADDNASGEELQDHTCAITKESRSVQ